MKAIVACLFVTALIHADENPPSALSAKEIAEGWILLYDGETTFGWTVLEQTSVKNGVLTVESPRGQAQYPALPKGQLKSDLFDKAHEKLDFVHFVASSTPYEIKSLKYRPADMKPIFNGKDLAGWKLFEGDPKRKASKFEVTKDGELKVSNGPGDLQTEAKYADFLLQFECKTNGPALNSGIFFRCLPDQYQQGYEAQIQNAYVKERTKPLDFGTGAIYRRVPARKVVSNDHEWFTMTVLAIGPHIRTWVNGYPVVDWKDDRKPADNARQGQYLKAGHLSIQGHDPTTDILFRNIRIVEIKRSP